MSSDLYWDPSFPGSGGGGGTIQTLQLNGTTLSLVPDGGSVTLPTGIVSSLGPTLLVSSLQALNSVLVGQNGEVEITSTGNITCSNIFNNLTNSFLGNFNTLTTATANVTTANIQTINTNLIRPSTILGNQIFTSSIQIGEQSRLKIAQDNFTPYTVVTQTSDALKLQTNVYVPSGYLLGAEAGNIGQLGANTIQSLQYISSATLYTGLIELNDVPISNDSQNLYYDGKVIFTGQRGDASQWSRFPAQSGVAFNGNNIGSIANADIGTTQQNLNVNILTTPYDSINPFSVPPPGNFTVGFEGSKGPLAGQPNIGLYGRDVVIKSGADPSQLPQYAEGRRIRLDAYAGNANTIIPLPGVNLDSEIDITAHGSQFANILPLAGNGKGVVNITAYNAATAGIPNPLYPGRINLNASYLTIGANTYLGIGDTQLITMQAYQNVIISGTDNIFDPLLTTPATIFRSKNGVAIVNSPQENSNRDSKLYVREIVGYSNPLGDYTTARLRIDGGQYGTTMVQTREIIGYPGGMNLIRIRDANGPWVDSLYGSISSSVAYTTLTSNVLQGEINAIVSGGGSNLSNITTWYEWPAQSTVVLNQDLVFAKNDLQPVGISSFQGVVFTDLIGTLNAIGAGSLNLGSNANAISTTITYDLDAVSLYNPATNEPSPIRVSTVIINNGIDNLLSVNQAGKLELNGQLIDPGSNIPSGISSFTNINTEFINADSHSTIFVQGYLNGQSNIGAPTYQVRYNPLNASSNFGNITTEGEGGLILSAWRNFSSVANFLDAKWNGGDYDVALDKISSINGLPISSFQGGGGVSSIQDWALYPVLSNSIQFGNQTAWIKGGGNALFTTSNGVNTIPVVAKAFSFFDANNPGIVSEMGFADDGVVSMTKNGLPTGLRVSTLSFLSSVVSVDSASQLSVDGRKVAAQWSAYPVLSTITANTSFTGPTRIMDLKNTGYSSFSFHLETIPPVGNNNALDFVVGGGDNRVVSSKPGQFYTPMRFDTEQMTINTVNPSGTRFGYLGSNEYTLIRGSFISTGQLLAATISTPQIGFTTGGMLTSSNDDLYFNGQALNVSTSIQNWAKYPANSNIVANNGITQVAANLTQVNGSAFTDVAPGVITLSNVAPQFVLESSSPNSLNISVDSNFTYFDSFYPIEIPGTTASNYIRLDNGIVTMTQGALIGSNGNNFYAVGSNMYWNGAAYTSSNYPITYLGGVPNTPAVFNYISNTSYQPVTTLGTFVPVTNQGIVSFSVSLPPSYSNIDAGIGVGPVGNYATSNTFIAQVGRINGGDYVRATIACDFTGWVGSNFDVRFRGSNTGTAFFLKSFYKPLPN